MSLYGLDYIVDDKKNLRLVEVNGISSGMRGFRHIYGDRRVEKTVYGMLADKYGEIRVNWPKATNVSEHSHDSMVNWLYCALSGDVPGKHIPLAFQSPKALWHLWVHDDLHDIIQQHDIPFAPYDGNECTVFNLHNEVLQDPLVNNFVAEEMAANKLFQYLALHNSSVTPTLIPTALIGLGVAPTNDLSVLYAISKSVIVKPLLGSQGRGVRQLPTRIIREVARQEGPIEEPRHLFDWPEYVEELVERKDYSFEPCMAVVQPFIRFNKSMVGPSCYGSIRAIVCNGQFVDSYLRVSDHPVVNLARGATAKPFVSDELRSVAEQTVQVLESRAAELTPDNYRETLYGRYFKPRARSPLTRFIERDITYRLAKPLIDTASLWVLKQQKTILEAMLREHLVALQDTRKTI